ncbi:MAG: YggT family protein [Anaerolineales bacterium]|jgi:YggT family protein|nr:MAG: YggT family protein [Anaerolineales bacterium]
MRVLNTFVRLLAGALNLAIFARILLSWMPMDRENRLVRIVYEITEPILGPIRRVLPALGGLDLSPLIALILIRVAERVLIMILQTVA